MSNRDYILEKLGIKGKYKDVGDWFYFYSDSRKDYEYKSFNWKFYIQVSEVNDSTVKLFKEIADFLFDKGVEHKIRAYFTGKRSIVIYPLNEDNAIMILAGLVSIIKKDEYSSILNRKGDADKLVILPGLAMRYEVMIKPEEYSVFLKDFIKEKLYKIY